MRKLKNSELNRLSVSDFKKAEKSPIIVILDNVRSLNNIGSIFRTCDAFLIEKVYLCGITAKPPHKDIHKTALGSTDSLDWEYFENTTEVVDKLRKEEVNIISIEQAEDSIMLHEFQPNKEIKHAVIFGNEVKGVSQDVVNKSDMVVEIPQFGTKHSLNISVSAGIVIWDLYNKIVK